MRDGMLKRGEAERKVAAGGVSGDAELFEIKFGERIIFVREQCAIGAANVLKRAGPSAAGIAHAAVFDVPSRDAGFFERVAKMSSVSQVVFGTPVAAVNEEDDRMRAFARGKTNVNKLIWVLPVRKAQIRIRRFLFQDGFTLHAMQYKTAARNSDAGLRSKLSAKHAVDKTK
jgi:hypothetical protein